MSGSPAHRPRSPLTGRSEEDPPVADVVELLKVALAVGMTKLVQS